MPASRKELINGKYIDDQMANGVPEGGTTNQVLTKASNTDYDTYWGNGGGGGGGGNTGAIGYAGAFQDTTSQSVLAANTATAIKVNTIDYSNGVTLHKDTANFIANWTSGSTINVTSVSSGTIYVGMTLISSTRFISSTFTGSISGNVLTVTSFTSGNSLATGFYITGTGILDNTQIVKLGTGTGGTGTYYINNFQNISSVSISGYNIKITALGTGTGGTGTYTISSTTSTAYSNISTYGVLTSSSKVSFANAGVYNIQWSGQFQNTDNAIQDIKVWIRKGNDGGSSSDIAGSTGLISIAARKSASAGEEAHSIVGWNYLIELVADDYIELYWSTTSTLVTLQFYDEGTSPARPSTASVIFTATSQASIGIGYYNLTSSTSNSMGVGSKTFTTNLSSTSTAFQVGMKVRAIYDSSNYMDGIITSFSNTTLVLNVEGYVGSGTYSAWGFAISAGIGSGSVTNVAALTLGTSGTDLSSSVTNQSTTPAITLNVPTASTLNRGVLSSTDWSTFNGKENVLTFNTPLSRSANAISIPVATTSENGYLSSTDWNTFNGKQNTLTLTTNNTSGAATLLGSTLNIPNYSGGGYTVRNVTTSPATYTDTSGKYVILVDTTSGAVTITLGSANSNNSEYIIKKISSSATANVTITSSSNVEFNTSAIIKNQGASVTIVSNGLASAASWFIV